MPTTPPDLPRDEIRLDALTLDAIVGIYPEERRTPQPLVADVALRLDLTTAARTSDLARSIDYARMAGELTYILREGRFRLLESAALTLLSHLLVPATPTAPRVGLASVGLAKPRVLGGAAVPRVTMTRAADDVAPRRISSAAGSFMLLYEGPEAIVLRSVGALSPQAASGVAWPFAAAISERVEPLELAGGGVLVVVRSAS